MPNGGNNLSSLAFCICCHRKKIKPLMCVNTMRHKVPLIFFTDLVIIWQNFYYFHTGWRYIPTGCTSGSLLRSPSRSAAKHLHQTASKTHQNIYCNNITTATYNHRCYKYKITCIIPTKYHKVKAKYAYTHRVSQMDQMPSHLVL